MILIVRKKQSNYSAIQYPGPFTDELVTFLAGAKKVLNTVSLDGVWKLQIQVDDVTGAIEKIAVGDWILKDQNNVFFTVKEAQFANKYEIVPT